MTEPVPPNSPETVPHLQWLKGALEYRGRLRALKVLVAASAGAALAFGLVLSVRYAFPESKGMAKVAALPLVMTMAIFYVALLQLLLGERVVSTDDGKQEASCLVVGAVCVSFGLFVFTVVGAVVMALR